MQLEIKKFAEKYGGGQNGILPPHAGTLVFGATTSTPPEGMALNYQDPTTILVTSSYQKELTQFITSIAGMIEYTTSTMDLEAVILSNQRDYPELDQKFQKSPSFKGVNNVKDENSLLQTLTWLNRHTPATYPALLLLIDGLEDVINMSPTNLQLLTGLIDRPRRKSITSMATLNTQNMRDPDINTVASKFRTHIHGTGRNNYTFLHDGIEFVIPHN